MTYILLNLIWFILFILLVIENEKLNRRCDYLIGKIFNMKIRIMSLKSQLPKRDPKTGRFIKK